MKILFWNTKNGHLVDQIAELLVEEDVDLAAICETTEEVVKLVIHAIERKYGRQYRLQETPGCDRIKALIKSDQPNIDLLNQHKYYSLLKVGLTGNEVILGVVHFPSKQYHSLDEIRAVAENLNRQVASEESAHGIAHTLVIGDFNVDPFELPMISFSGLAATNSIDIIDNDSVTRAGENKRLFYNPMWTLYATQQKHPGSHRYRRLGEDVIHWHYIDQVIMRPSLIPHFDVGSLRVIDKTSSFDLRNRNGVPSVSDHLPISCELEFPK